MNKNVNLLLAALPAQQLALSLYAALPAAYWLPVGGSEEGNGIA